MDNNTNKCIPADLIELMELGKRGHLYALEIVYPADQETKVWRKRNLTVDEFKAVREAVMQGGLALLIEPGHWKIIPPCKFIDVDAYRQSGYFEEK